MLKDTLSLFVAVVLTMAFVGFSETALAQSEPKPNQYWWPKQLNL